MEEAAVAAAVAPHDCTPDTVAGRQTQSAAGTWHPIGRRCLAGACRRANRPAACCSDADDAGTWDCPTIRRPQRPGSWSEPPVAVAAAAAIAVG